MQIILKKTPKLLPWIKKRREICKRRIKRYLFGRDLRFWQHPVKFILSQSLNKLAKLILMLSGCNFSPRRLFTLLAKHKVSLAFQTWRFICCLYIRDLRVQRKRYTFTYVLFNTQILNQLMLYYVVKSFKLESKKIHSKFSHKIAES